MTAHGGDVWDLGFPLSEILDFSANVNPCGLPPRARERLAKDAADPRLLGFYPDPSARSLANALSKKLDVAVDSIVVGPGAESLLSPILRHLEPARVLVPIPAFSEYRRVCIQHRIEFVPFQLDRAELFRTSVDRLCRLIESESPAVVLLNNPHNPTGALLEANEVCRVLETATSRGTTLLLDEAFIDYAPHASLVREAAEHPAIIVIRSLTKFYGCPALRVGYAVACPETIRHIRSLMPAWPVTQLAVDALAEAVADRDYAERSLRENAREREQLAASLRNLGVFVFPSAANYLFFELRPDMPPASELRERLIATHRILIRNCDSYQGLSPGRYVRVAVRSSDDNRRLAAALTELLT